MAAGGAGELARRPEDVEGVGLQVGDLAGDGPGPGGRQQAGGRGGQQQGGSQSQGGRAPEAGARPEHQDALASDAAAGSAVRTTRLVVAETSTSRVSQRCLRMVSRAAILTRTIANDITM